MLFDHIREKATPEEVARLLPLVSVQRREQALRFKHVLGQFCCLQSYRMLMELVAAVSPTMDGQCPEFAYNEYGQPYFPARPDLHFSISHTKDAILVGLSLLPIGVDVESLRNPSQGLIERTMSPREQASIHDHAGFIALWTQKEAYLKWSGTGIVDDLTHALDHADERHLQTFAPAGKNYIYSVYESDF